MLALALRETGPAVERDWRPAAAPGEALIRPLLAGVCATDLELVRGYMGFRGVLGHEWVGVVEEAPERGWVGRRVTGEINCACRNCEVCTAGRTHHCPRRTVLGILGRDGAFAERLRLPLANLHEVPAGVDDLAAVFTEPLAAACRITEQIHVGPTDHVVVLGAGRLGQLCVRVLALTGARVTAVSRDPARLALLPRGVTGVDTAAPLPPVCADIVVDCTGDAAGLAAATRVVRPGGTIVLKTTVHAPEAVSPVPWVIDEVTLVGSRCGPFAPALRLLASGLVDPTPLVSEVLPLEQGLAALERAAAPGVLKVLLRIPG